MKTFFYWIVLFCVPAFSDNAKLIAEKKRCEKKNARACTYVGFELYESGKKAEGLSLFQKACFEFKPSDPQACNNWAYYHFVKQGKPSEALPLFTEACEKGLGQACFNAGWVYDEVKNLGDAEANYTRACELKYFKGCHSLGYIYKHQAKTARAIEYFRAACKGRISVSCDELNALENKPGAYEKLVSSYSKGCASGDGNLCSHFGFNQEQKGKLKEAKELYVKACKLGDSYGCEKEKEFSLKTNKAPVVVKYEMNHLESGITTAYMAHPASGKVLVFLRVPTGSFEDRNFAPETAHTTEHLLFRDKSAGVKSYLDNFQENKVEVNGLTFERATQYYATGEPNRLGYILETFSRMMHPRTFSNEELDKAKEEVRLESSRMLNLFGSLYQYSNIEYEESEFNSSFDGVKPYEWIWPFYRPVELSDTSLFFDKFYSPASMSIAVVGDFEIESAKKEINRTFGSLPLRPAFNSIEPTPRREIRPYEVRSTSWTPTITIGTKLHDMNPEKEIVIRAYFKDLRNRLMRRLRTEDAKTYSVVDSVQVDRVGFGTGTVFYQLKPENYFKDVNEIRSLIKEETIEGKLTQQTIDSMRTSYRNDFNSRGVDVDSLSQAIDYQLFLFKTYGESRTPLQILDSVDDEKIKTYLRDSFKPEDKYEVLGVPYPFFKGDSIVFVFLSLAFGIAIGIHRGRRRAVKRPYLHPRWGNKIGAGFVCVMGIIVYLSSPFWWNPLWNLIPAYKNSLFLQYFSWMLLGFTIGLLTYLLAHRVLIWGSPHHEGKVPSVRPPDQERLAG